MATGSCKHLVTLVTFTLFSLCLSSSVPVITWWNGKSVSHTSTNILAGHTLLKKEFQAYFEPFAKTSDVLIVFLQDELSIDDFTRYGASFPFIKSSLQSNDHVIMPSVTQSDGSIVDLLSSIQKSNIIEVSLETDWKSYDIASKLKDGATNLVIIQLEPVMGSSGKAKESILKRNDELMNTVSASFAKALKSIATFFTAESQAQDVKNILINEQLDNSHNLNSRHLLAATSEDLSRFASSECLALHVRGVKFGHNGGKENLTEILDVVKNETQYGGDCTNTTNGYYSIILKIETDKEPVKKDTTVTINLRRLNKRLEWGCYSINVRGDFNGDAGVVSLDETFECGMQSLPWKVTAYNSMVSPLQYSFACKGMRFTTKNYTIAFEGLQMQPLESSMNSTASFKGFKEAVNCEGFFTLPILTGLFVGYLLIMSLFLGTSMLMNIQTQDRFDDPKGKTITVAAQE